MEKKDNDSDNENAEFKSDQRRSKDRSPSPDVKSTAVVKYTAFHSPVSYSRLQCNTDLNLPPSNWGAPNDSYGSREILTGETGLSSFRMAHMFPDCVGEVDVISSAECIKTLLKLPYQPNGTVSMMVHRVENTLLLDEFVYDYLMKSEWSWLKDFYKENILKTMSEQERSLMLVPASSASRELTHRFLSHSVAGAEPTRVCRPEPLLADAKPEVTPNEHLYNQNVHWTFEDIHMLIGSDLPIFGDKDRPCVSLRLRDAREPINVLTGIDYWLDNLMCNVPEVLMCYHLDGIVQKYEPMKTEELPHIENSRFSPKVIRNVAQNILSFLKSNATKAGHTYWLFKGPHDDVVKLYDLTSLCPDNLDNPFTTPVAMLLYRVAKSMVIQNRSKRHVKQLLENVIELLKEDKFPQIVASSQYMLSGLYLPGDTNPACPDFKDEPFDSDETDQEYACDGDATQERDDDNFPKTDANSQNNDECKQDSNSPSGESERDKSDENSLAVQIRGLSLNNIGDRVRNIKENKTSNESGLGSGVPARCGRALYHAARGLHALSLLHKCSDADEERERLKQQIIYEEQNPKMANPFEPIQMDYKPIIKKDKKEKEHISRSRRRKRERKSSEKSANSLIETNTNIDKNAILIRKEKRLFPSLSESNRDDNYAWKLHLKILLYEKICLAYATLAEYSYSHEQYGFSLKYIDIASKCQKLLSNMIIKSRVVDATCLIGRVGDNYFQLSKHWGRLEVFRKQFETDHETDAKLRQEIENDLVEEIDGATSDEFDLDICIPDTESTSMLLACAHYRRAVETSDGSLKQNELLRRLASVNNELAVRYMNEGQQIYIKYVEEEDNDKAKELLKQFDCLARKSEECLDEATKIFERVADAPNLALLYCNRARYMRFKAHCDTGGFTVNKLSLYTRGEELYLSALRLLGGREACGAASVWELVCWELSCHMYSRASLMQDCPDVYTSGVGDVADAFKQALKYCLLSPGPRQESYQFRAAKIYHRLASLYHSQYRNSGSDGLRVRALCQQTLGNYVRAANMFASLGDAREFLRVRLEHVAAVEHQAATSNNLKLKSLQTALQLLCQSLSVIQIIKDRDPEDEPAIEEEDEKNIKNEATLLTLFVQRLHTTFKNIIQYCRSKNNKDYERMTEMYKSMYSASLKMKKNDDLKAHATVICEVLEQIEAIHREYEQS